MLKRTIKPLWETMDLINPDRQTINGESLMLLPYPSQVCQRSLNRLWGKKSADK